MMSKNFLLSKKQQKFTVSQRKHLENGKQRAYSKVLELHVTHACTAEQLLNLHLVLMSIRFQKNATSVTVIPKSKLTILKILKDNPSTLDHFTLNILCLRMLVQESIFHEKGCRPFWTAQCDATSENRRSCGCLPGPPRAFRIRPHRVNRYQGGWIHHRP